MAAEGKTKKATKIDKGIKVNLIPSDEIMSNRLYSNHVQVIQSPFDFTLQFCDVTPILDVKKVVEDKGDHKIPLVAEIAIPFELMPNLIKALQSQLEKYQANK